MKVKSLYVLPVVFFASLPTVANALDDSDASARQSFVIAQADSHAGHDMGGKANKATAKGTIHSVDLSTRKINLTHAPIPELGWAAMTMDLVATKRVKLESLKEGDVVEFEVKKGRDNMFRITKIKPAQ